MAVSLRMITEDDLKMMMNWSRTGSVAGVMKENTALSFEGWRRWFKTVEGNDKYRFWIVETDADPAGIIYLKDIDWIHRNTKWGLYLEEEKQNTLDPAWSLEMSLYDYCFDILELEEVFSEAPKPDHLSMSDTKWEQLREGRVYEKIGFALFFDRGGRPHHIGMEVADIAGSVSCFRTLGWVPEGEIKYDSLRNARITFLTNRYTNGVLELVCRDDGGSQDTDMSPFHICYEVKDIKRTIAILEHEGYVLTDPPKSSAVFDDHMVAFMYNGNAGLVELLEGDI